MINFIKAFSIFASTIIGVGIFGLPYIALKAGFFVTVLYFFVMGVVAIAIHFLLADVCLGTKGFFREPGYVEKYMGSTWKKINFMLLGLGLTGALLAYLIVGGGFLKLFFEPYLGPYLGDNILIYTLLFFLPGAYLIFRGIKNIVQIELALLLIFFGIIVLFFIKAAPFINVDYLMDAKLEFFALPYGVVLFSLWGTALIPETKEILGRNQRYLKKVIVSGIIIAAITYLFFIFIVLGSSGPNTTKEAIKGLSYVLGDDIIRIGFIFGIITCFTSFLTLALTIKKVLWYDFNINKDVAWFIACFTPLFLFVIGVREFIEVISITGAIALGLEAVLIVFLYRAFLWQKHSRKMNPWIYLLPAIFMLGIFAEVFYQVIKW